MSTFTQKLFIIGLFLNLSTTLTLNAQITCSWDINPWDKDKSTFLCDGIILVKPTMYIYRSPVNGGSQGIDTADPRNAKIFMSAFNDDRKKNDKYSLVSIWEPSAWGVKSTFYYLIPKNLVSTSTYTVLPSGDVECENSCYNDLKYTNNLIKFRNFIVKYPNSTKKNEVLNKINTIENENLVAENNRILIAKREEEELKIKLKKEREDAIIQEKRTLANGTSFKDPRDGKVYQIVTIGNKVWFAQNLAYQTNTSKDNYLYSDKLGYFYTQSDAKKACPAGWGLPSKWDWEIMFQEACKCNDKEEAMNLTGYKLKAKSGWGNGYNVHGGYNGSNESGFNALPIAIEDNRYDYTFKGQYAHWWTSSNISNGCVYMGEKQECAYYISLCSQIYNDKSVLFPSNSKLTNYLSIRCIKK